MACRCSIFAAFIEIILARRLDICCAKLSEQMRLRLSVCLCRFVILSCFSKGQITFLLCMLRKELAGRRYRFYQVMVIRGVAPTASKSTNPRTQNELGSSCFFCCDSPLRGHDHDRCTFLSVLRQTFFFACRKVIYDLKKNRRWYKMNLQ